MVTSAEPIMRVAVLDIGVSLTFRFGVMLTWCGLLARLLRFHILFAISGIMEKEVSQLSALAHPQRLAIFRLLARRYPDQLPAGEIGVALALRPSTLSAYLAALHGAGLIMQERRGTSLRYSVALKGPASLLGFLYHDCCRARADLADSKPNAGRIRNVLFLCKDNAVTSLMAEAVLRSLAGERFEVFSAATGAARTPDPLAMALLHDKGHETGILWSKPLNDLSGADAPRMDFVFTLCDLAANADLPAWPGQPAKAHWSLPGTDGAEQPEAITQAYAILHHRLAAFANLPDDLPRAALQRRIDDIARSGQPGSG